jgi:hypothetical protein
VSLDQHAALTQAGEIMGAFLVYSTDYTPENSMSLEDVGKAYLKVGKEFYDGRSVNLAEVILRHGGEARQARDEFARLSADRRSMVIEFLNSLVLFPPDDTASNLDPGDRNAAGFPQSGHGAIKLTVLFNDPADVE